MSLAAIPAFLIARRVLRPPLALLGAALTVAVPSMVYTTTVMTENAFYPVFLLALWALLRVLEEPGWRRTAVLAVVLVAALLIRVQAGALVAHRAHGPARPGRVRRRLAAAAAVRPALRGAARRRRPRRPRHGRPGAVAREPPRRVCRRRGEPLRRRARAPLLALAPRGDHAVQRHHPRRRPRACSSSDSATRRPPCARTSPRPSRRSSG